ncbi:MAG: type II toxin-antitoxin system RelB/DinJ family antitoxin [Desulfonatronovibrio sp.]
MPANSLVQARIDPETKERAAAVLENMGLSVSDAVRILLTRVAHEGGLPVGLTADPAAHDVWFRSKVMEAMEDSRPPMTHDEVEAHFDVKNKRIICCDN